MDKFCTLPSMVQYVLNTYRNSYALNERINGEWHGMSTETFVERIRRLSLGLRSLGLQKGDTVGIIARPSPHWLIIDLAIMSAGGVSVPLFPHISQKNFLYEVDNANLKFIFVVDGEYWPAVSPHHTLFKKVITLNIDDRQEGDHVINFNEVLRMGDALSKKNPSLFAEMRDSIQENDLATIIYTSGSTGVPKGVELTHRNLIAQLRSSRTRFPLDPSSDKILSVLPTAHVFERMLVYYYVSSGVRIYFADDLKNLMQLFKEVKPTGSAMVPLMLEKIYSRIISTIESSGLLKRTLGRWMVKLAHRPVTNKIPRLAYALADKMLYSKIRESMGGCFSRIIVGGAPLKKELCEFFLNVGIPLYQGYGLTESSPVLSTNYPDHNKPGTVGPAFPDVEVKISPEGEIWARGPNIMRGYHRDPEGTKEILDAEGWLHTGDRGMIDEHGFVSVTGRFKEIMKTSGGKMVAPVPIEQALCEAPFVDMAMVIANDRKFVTCLLLPNFDLLNTRKKEQKLEHLSHEDFLDGPFMKQQTDTLLKQVNNQLNEWEQVRAYRFIASPLSVAEGELTPTFKINREVVAKKYKTLIDNMY